MRKLKISGYNKYDRYQILKSGYNSYEKLRKKEDEGIRPFFRNRDFNRDKRKEEKKNKKNKWFQTKNSKENESQFSSVFFVPATPGSVLLKMLKKTEERFKIDNKSRKQVEESISTN